MAIQIILICILFVGVLFSNTAMLISRRSKPIMLQPKYEVLLSYFSHFLECGRL